MKDDTVVELENHQLLSFYGISDSTPIFLENLSLGLIKIETVLQGDNAVRIDNLITNVGCGSGPSQRKVPAADRHNLRSPDAA
jgi:hypothetical protein